jgi:DNA-binding beta-propeller fold protein YncE
MNKTPVRAAILAASVALAFPAAADIAVSANDNKLYNDNGTTKTVANPAPDYVSIIDLSSSPPRVIAEVRAPASVTGPPFSVAVSRDESFALVTAAQKIDPADATRIVPDNKLSVIDLRANPPAVIATLEAGSLAAGVSMNHAGTLALVANRGEGTVSIFTINGKTLTPAGKLKLGDEKSGPSHVAFTPDDKRALVTRDGDNTISVLNIDGAKVESANRDFGTGLRPYGVVMTPDGRKAVVANVGRTTGDADTVSLVDMAANPPRVIDNATVGTGPEGIALSADGKVVAVVTHNGSNRAKNSPFYNANGKLVLLRVDGDRLVRFAEAPIGGWSQGAAFSRDGRTILVQNMIEHDIQVFRLDGDKLSDTGQRIKINGGPAGIRTAW